jgi:hypothetical protein
MLVGVGASPLLCCDVIDSFTSGNFIVCLPMLSVPAAADRYNLFTVLFCYYTVCRTSD